MKTTNQRIPKDYFSNFLAEFAALVLNGYLYEILDVEKIPRSSHYRFGEFLSLEIKILREFLLPANLNVAPNEEIQQRLKSIEVVIIYFMGDTATLTEGFKKADVVTEKGKFQQRTLGRILAARQYDPVAVKFCQDYKSLLS